MTIAGSDSGGGAGIQADLRVFAAFGVFGTSAITALTAQNTQEVRGVFPVDPAFIRLQIETVLDDIGADAVKTGMLGSAPVVREVAAVLRERRPPALVVDPVMVAATGARLLEPDAEEALKTELIPLADVVTPNLDETEVLVGYSVRDVETMKKAAQDLHRLGCRYVLVKGGHLEGDPVDVLYDGTDFEYFHAERIPTRNTHGSGCTYASAIAAGLATGLTVPEAVRQAKGYLHEAIRLAPDIGRGSGPLQHLPTLVPWGQQSGS